MICSVFSRIAVMFLNIHFGGALSGIDSNFFSQSIFPKSGATRFTSSPKPTRTATTSVPSSPG